VPPPGPEKKKKKKKGGGKPLRRGGGNAKKFGKLFSIWGHQFSENRGGKTSNPEKGGLENRVPKPPRGGEEFFFFSWASFRDGHGAQPKIVIFGGVFVLGDGSPNPEGKQAVGSRLAGPCFGGFTYGSVSVSGGKGAPPFLFLVVNQTPGGGARGFPQKNKTEN